VLGSGRMLTTLLLMVPVAAAACRSGAEAINDSMYIAIVHKMRARI